MLLFLLNCWRERTGHGGSCMARTSAAGFTSRFRGEKRSSLEHRALVDTAIPLLSAAFVVAAMSVGTLAHAFSDDAADGARRPESGSVACWLISSASAARHPTTSTPSASTARWPRRFGRMAWISTFVEPKAGGKRGNGRPGFRPRRSSRRSTTGVAARRVDLQHADPGGD